MVIAQIIKIKTGKGMMKASKSFSQIKISIEVRGQDNETKKLKVIETHRFSLILSLFQFMWILLSVSTGKDYSFVEIIIVVH